MTMDTSRRLSETGSTAGNDIPAVARRAFNRHKNHARYRGIPFTFDLPTWWAWWSADGRWSRRGNGRDALVMARFGDAGPYAPGNVYAATHAQNGWDVSPERRRAAAFVGWATERAQGLRRKRATGAAHGRARAVRTPAGTFGTVTDAAQHHEITRATVHYRVRSGAEGWRWAAPEEAAALRTG